MRRKLLVADDSVTIQRVVALSFAGEEVEIEFATDGNKALEMIRDGRPDIVLADVMMPGLTGYQLCEKVKADPDIGQTPVVLLVGTFEPFDQAEAGRVRSDGYLTKPFDTDELVQTYHSLIERSTRPHGEERGNEPPSSGVPDSAAAANPIIAGEVLVSSRTRESFLGEGRILDILPPATVSGAWSESPSATKPQTGPPTHIVRSVVEDIVRQLAPEIVREVAWEVVPEMSEMMIRESMSREKSPGR